MTTSQSTVETTVSDLLKSVGAWRIGHFLLTSGLHSDQYMQCQKVLQYPQFGNFLADLLVEKLLDHKIKPDVVVGPALGAVHWEVFVAEAFGRNAHQNKNDYFLSVDTVAEATKDHNVEKMVRAVFAERAAGSDDFSIRRGIELNAGDKVLVVEDVTTTGGSARKVVELVREMGAKPIGVGAILDRSGGKAQFDVPFVSLLSLNLWTYEPDGCPLCKAGTVAEKPGSSKK